MANHAQTYATRSKFWHRWWRQIDSSLLWNDSFWNHSILWQQFQPQPNKSPVWRFPERDPRSFQWPPATRPTRWTEHCDIWNDSTYFCNTTIVCGRKHTTSPCVAIVLVPVWRHCKLTVGRLPETLQVAPWNPFCCSRRKSRWIGLHRRTTALFITCHYTIGHGDVFDFSPLC